MKVDLEGVVGRIVTFKNARVEGLPAPETGVVTHVLHDFAWDVGSAWTMLKVTFKGDEAGYRRIITRDELLAQHPGLEVTDGSD